MDASSTSAAQPLDSGISQTTSPAACSNQAASDPNYTLIREEPRKRSRTIERDKLQLARLSVPGWDSLVVWECELRDLPRAELKLRDFLDRGHDR